MVKLQRTKEKEKGTGQPALREKNLNRRELKDDEKDHSWNCDGKERGKNSLNKRKGERTKKIDISSKSIKEEGVFRFCHH